MWPDLTPRDQRPTLVGSILLFAGAAVMLVVVPGMASRVGGPSQCEKERRLLHRTADGTDEGVTAAVEVTIACDFRCAVATRGHHQARATLAEAELTDSTFVEYAKANVAAAAQRETELCGGPRTGAPPTPDQIATMRRPGPPQPRSLCVRQHDYGYETGYWMWSEWLDDLYCVIPGGRQ